MNLQESIMAAYKDGLVNKEFVCEKLKIMSNGDPKGDTALANFSDAMMSEFAKGKLPKDTVKVFIKIDNLKSGEPKITTKLTHADKKMEMSIDSYFKEKDILKIFKSKVGTIAGEDAVQASFTFKNYPDPEGMSSTYGPCVDVKV